MATATPTTDKPVTKKRSQRAGVPKVKDETHTRTAVDELAPKSRLLQEVPLDSIDPHPANPRKHLGDLTELADSIKEQGVVQAVTLVPVAGSGKFPTRYRPIAGHRRCAAARLAGLDTVPATIREGMSDADQLEVMLVENLHRSDLTVFEEAHGMRALFDMGVKRTHIAKRTGRATKTVGQRLSLADLPPSAETMVDNRQLTMDEALALADLRAADKGVYDDLCAQLDAGQLKGWAIGEARRKIERLQADEKYLAGLTAAGVAWTQDRDDLPADARTLASLSGLTVDEHKTCPGHITLIGTAEWFAAEQQAYSYCKDPATHHPEAFNDSGTPKTTAPSPEAEERAATNAEWQAAADSRWLWVSQLLATTGPAQSRARQVLIDHALTIVCSNHGAGSTGHPSPDSPWPADTTAALALAIVHDSDAEVPSDSWSATRLVENADEEWMRSSVDRVRAYLTLLSIAGYELTAREQELLDALPAADAASDEGGEQS